MRSLLTILIAVSCAGVAFAQEPPVPVGRVPAVTVVDSSEWERVLVPFAIPSRLRGGQRSLWANEFGGFNDGSAAVIVHSDPSCETCPSKEIAPRSGAQLDSVAVRPAGAQGSFIWVKREAQEHLSYHLIVYDVTRPGDTTGTEIPLVTEDDVFGGRQITLINIPLGPMTRSNLRIYDFDGPTGGEVTVRLYGSRAGLSLGERKVRLSASEEPLPQFPTVPGFAFLALESLPELQGVTGAMRVEIVTAPGQKIWAFVAVTGNETNHVRTITPQTGGSRRTALPSN